MLFSISVYLEYYVFILLSVILSQDYKHEQVSNNDRNNETWMEIE